MIIYSDKFPETLKHDVEIEEVVIIHGLFFSFLQQYDNKMKWSINKDFSKQLPNKKRTNVSWTTYLRKNKCIRWSHLSNLLFFCRKRECWLWCLSYAYHYLYNKHNVIFDVRLYLIKQFHDMKDFSIYYCNSFMVTYV